MTDWIAVMKEQGEIASKMSVLVAKALGLPSLTPQETGRLYKLVVKGSQNFDRILQDIDADEEDVPDGLVTAADAIDNIWGKLVVAVANKSREARNLAPIEMKDDKGE